MCLSSNMVQSIIIHPLLDVSLLMLQGPFFIRFILMLFNNENNYFSLFVCIC